MILHLSNYFLLYIIWLSCSIRPRSKWDQEYTGVFINPVNSSSAIIRETQFSSSLESWRSSQCLQQISWGEARHRDQVHRLSPLQLTAFVAFTRQQKIDIDSHLQHCRLFFSSLLCSLRTGKLFSSFSQSLDDDDDEVIRPTCAK